MRILAIETSCDDTSIALIEAEKSAGKNGAPVFKVLENIVSSQTEIHRHWGGVVPNLAKREHLKNLPLIWRQILERRAISDRIEVDSERVNAASARRPEEVYPRRYSDEGQQGNRRINAFHPDLLAVTVGPGLEPALWAGIEFAKNLAQELKVPFVGANHLEGHLYSFLLEQGVATSDPATRQSRNGAGKRQATSKDQTYKHIPHVAFPMSHNLDFPVIALLVSGGHTMLLLMKDLYHWKKLGETRDDAVGEAFDKVARIIGLPYPGGPEIEKLAREGNPAAIKFPRPMIHEKNYEFSFSGLKTSVLYFMREHGPLVVDGKRNSKPSSRSADEAVPTAVLRGGATKKSAASAFPLKDIAASFQAAAIDTLVGKTLRAVREFGAKSVILCGGVAANQALRETLQKNVESAGAQFFAPPMEYNSDNAAMIAASAYIRHVRRKKKLPLEANGNLSL